MFLNILQILQERTGVGGLDLHLHQNETQTHAFYRKIFEIFKNTFFDRTPPLTVFEPSTSALYCSLDNKT